MKKPYVKKLPDYNGMKVFLVDDSWIRNNLDTSFAEYGTHYSNHCVPHDELWIGNDTEQKEIPAWTREAFDQFKAASRGKTIEKAEDSAERDTYSFRNKIKHDDKVKESIYSRFGPITIWWVDGDAIRAKYNSDFQEGGHGFIYRYIPKNEIWLEKLHNNDAHFILLHEIHEMNKMRLLGWPYLKAHNSANKVETQARKDPKQLERLLDAEFAIASQNKEKL